MTQAIVECITVPVRSGYPAVNPNKEREQLHKIAPLVKANLLLEELLQAPEWFETRADTVGGEQITTDVRPITGLMIARLYRNPHKTWVVYQRLQAARLSYKEGDKETVNSKLDPRRANVTTPLISLASAVLGYGYMSADNPFIEKAEQMLKAKETSVAQLRVTNLNDGIVMPDPGLYAQAAQSALGEQHNEVATTFFDLKAIIAAKKFMGRGAGKLNEQNALTMDEVHLIYRMADLALAIMAWSDAGGLQKPGRKSRVNQRLPQVARPNGFADYEKMDEFRLNAFIGSSLFQGLFDVAWGE